MDKLETVLPKKHMKRGILESIIQQKFDEGQGRDIFKFLLENASTDTLESINEKVG